MGYAAAPGVAFIVSGIEAFFTAIIIKREREDQKIQRFEA